MAIDISIIIVGYTANQIEGVMGVISFLGVCIFGVHFYVSCDLYELAVSKRLIIIFARNSYALCL